VGFGGYEAWTNQVYAEEARNASRLDAKLKLEEHWLQRGVTARRARNEGRKAKLMEMRAVRASMIGPQGTAKLVTAANDTKTKVVIDAENVTKRFPSDGSGERTIIRDFTFRITRGDRIGVVGANGTGKTTLLKLLTGEIPPDEGTVKRAKTLDGIVIDQQRKLMSPEKRIRDVLADGGDWIEVLGEKKHVAGYLKEFLFDPNLIDAREFARHSNLLVLDEPTNDLDLETLDLLQEVIADYDGTVLIVSHDRDFLDRTVTVTLGLDGSGKVDIVAGGYEDWDRKRVAPRPESRKTAEGKKSEASPPPPPPKSRAKLSYKDQRDLDLLPSEIEKLEAQIAKEETLLGDPDLYAKNPKRFEELTRSIEQARTQKEASELRWLELAEMADALN
jgi:ATP-binding cassette subfamily F protein uup